MTSVWCLIHFKDSTVKLDKIGWSKNLGCSNGHPSELPNLRWSSKCSSKEARPFAFDWPEDVIVLAAWKKTIGSDMVRISNCMHTYYIYLYASYLQYVYKMSSSNWNFLGNFETQTVWVMCKLTSWQAIYTHYIDPKKTLCEASRTSKIKVAEVRHVFLSPSWFPSCTGSAVSCFQMSDVSFCVFFQLMCREVCTTKTQSTSSISSIWSPRSEYRRAPLISTPARGPEMSRAPRAVVASPTISGISTIGAPSQAPRQVRSQSQSSPYVTPFRQTRSFTPPGVMVPAWAWLPAPPVAVVKASPKEGMENLPQHALKVLPTPNRSRSLQRTPLRVIQVTRGSLNPNAGQGLNVLQVMNPSDVWERCTTVTCPFFFHKKFKHDSQSIDIYSL